MRFYANIFLNMIVEDRRNDIHRVIKYSDRYTIYIKRPKFLQLLVEEIEVWKMKSES